MKENHIVNVPKYLLKTKKLECEHDNICFQNYKIKIKSFKKKI